jgi:acyl-CoA thioester hydrolase
MALTHERTFRVRHYECDAYGHVNNVQYLRYMQEAAFDASAAAGYDLARYIRLGHHWLVRETEIEYLTALQYGDSVRVRTWVEDFHRVRSRRVYELYKVSSGELAARGATEWVYVHSQTLQPARVPPEMVAAFMPDGQPPPARRRPFPVAPPAPPGVFTMRRKVMWQEIDAAGHVNNAQYLAYVSDCGFEVAEAYGWPAGRMQAAGFGILVRRHHVQYRQPALLGDTVEVSTWVYNMRRATGSRAYTITRAGDGAQLALAHVSYVWVNLETMLPRRLPADFLADFAPNIVGEGEMKEERHWPS